MNSSTASPVVYGIPNCDTVKRAREALATSHPAYVFHDFKKQGLSESLLAHWLAQHDWTTLLNRQGTTWRRLTEEQRMAVTDQATALACMLQQPSLVKRPVIQWPDGRITVGFKNGVFGA